jgi:hypothetical protein
MKVLSLFCVFSMCAAGVFCQRFSFSGGLSLFPDTEKTREYVSARVEHPFFELFTGADFCQTGSGKPPGDEAEAQYAGQVNLMRVFSLSAGNLCKSGILSRLAYPIPSTYTSALSAPSLPTVAAPSSVPHATGSNPEAVAIQVRPPVVRGSEIEYYRNTQNKQGFTIAAPLTFGSTRIRMGAGACTYRLIPPKETSWYLDQPQFAEDTYTSFLYEATVRTRFGPARRRTRKIDPGEVPSFRKRLAAAFSPVAVTWYGASGMAEAPYGGFDPWFRMDGGVSAGVFTLKSRVFFAPHDFWTPAGRLVPHKLRYMVNPLVNLPLSKQRGIILGAGLVYAQDSATELHTARLSSRISTGAFSLSTTAALDNWLVESGTPTPCGDTTESIQVGVNNNFPMVKTAVTFRVKKYVNSAWDEKKREYTTGISASPRLSGVKWAPLVPAGSLRVDAVVYPDGRKRSTVASALRWKAQTKRVKVSGNIDVTVAESNY